jgi:elongator complex protein 2
VLFDCFGLLFWIDLLITLQSDGRGVETLLVGHTDTVNAVKFLKISSGLLLVSGSVDKSVRIWRQSGLPVGVGTQAANYQCIQVLDEHQSSVNCIAVCSGAEIFVTGSADATVKIWKIDASTHGLHVQLMQSIKVTPRYFPLALALSPLNGASNSYVLAAAGTAAFVQLYIADSLPEFKLQATLSGHEGWIRSLSFAHENDSPGSDLLLASASQDKYIRLWRLHQGKELPPAAAGSDPAFGSFLPGKSLSNKAHRFTAGGKDYSTTFEALLLGHEDWIYSAVWKTKGSTLQLLSASADNSLSIWEQDPASTVWISTARLGEISAQKGSTTATGSTGGFWTGLWSPSGQRVACLGRTGSWRIWSFDSQQDRWIQEIGISGHTQAVTGIGWSRRGDYLLSTSSDQTTRLHARWKRHGQTTWHEMARPQIHGYDLNCIETLGDSQFVSGADEKLLRVFKESKAVADLLERLCNIPNTEFHTLPDAANMPVLGLSNKAISAISSTDIEDPTNSDAEPEDPTSVANKSTLYLNHPPLEDHLSKHTLWPEVEKLYGHGYEISTLAASHDGSVVATACKASSLEHAVIRLFETSTWTEVKPPLTAHSLTVTRLRFSADDTHLLSVGRDRQWAVFQRRESRYELLEANAKAHSRMILDAAWAPGGSKAFATAGRDKLVKFWKREGESGGFVCNHKIQEDSPVTAIDFVDSTLEDGFAYLAAGTEVGQISVYRINLAKLEVVLNFMVDKG